MPEELPTPKKSLKQLEKENKRNLKKTENWTEYRIGYNATNY